MARERKFDQVGPVLFSTDGLANGTIFLPTTKGFKVNLSVTVSADSLPDLDLKVKRVTKNYIVVGKNGNIDFKEDVSAYTVALNAKVVQHEQVRTSIPLDDQNSSSYEREPTLARRVVLVDEYGNLFGTENPVPVIGDSSGSEQSTIKNPIISNVSAINANQEYSFSIPSATKKFYFKARGMSKIQFSFLSGNSNTVFCSLSPGETYSEDTLKLDDSLNVYFRTSKPNEIIEIVRWE